MITIETLALLGVGMVAAQIGFAALFTRDWVAAIERSYFQIMALAVVALYIIMST